MKITPNTQAQARRLGHQGNATTPVFPLEYATVDLKFL